MAGRPRREDWRAWLPDDAPAPAPEALITRDQLLATLGRLGLPVNRHTLRHWEQQGVLPAPVRQRRAGATRGLYPPWMVDLVWRLKRYRDEGLALGDLSGRMRADARDLARRGAAGRFIPGRSAFGDFLAEHYPAEVAALEEPPGEPTGYPFAPLPISPALHEQLEALVSALAYEAERTGFVAVAATVVLISASGEQLPTPIRPRPPPPGSK